MPRFLIPILVLAIASWVVFLIILNYTSPVAAGPASDQTLPVIYFLTALLGALTFSTTLFFYWITNLKNHPWDKKLLARQSLRRGFLLGLWFIGFLLLRLTQTYHLINLILLTAVLIGVEIAVRKNSF